MSRGRRFAFTFALLILCVGLVSVFWPREPLYQGRPVSVWVDELADPRYRVFGPAGVIQYRGPAQEVLRAMGPNAILPLATGMNRGDGIVGSRRYWILHSKAPEFIQRLLPSPQQRDDVRRQASSLLV